MNISSAAGISAIQSAQVRQQIDVAVLGKLRESTDQQAQAILSLLEDVSDSSAAPKSGDNQLDVTA